MEFVEKEPRYLLLNEIIYIPEKKNELRNVKYDRKQLRQYIMYNINAFVDDRLHLSTEDTV